MDRRIKIIAYTSIVVFSLLFTALIAYFVIYPLDVRARLKERQIYNEAQTFKQKADSIAQAAEFAVDSLITEKYNDSIAFVKQRESLKTNYSKKVKAYESRLADIDTLTDIQLNSSFSIREMLSDSSSKVW